MARALADLLRSRITLIWLVLIGATLASLLVGTDNIVTAAKAASVLVIAIAFVKVRFVGRYFMELRDAPTPLLAVFEGYCAVVCAILVVMFLVGK
jgi:heme/copper-type cytochrome/quinol oxidase subunit 4